MDNKEMEKIMNAQKRLVVYDNNIETITYRNVLIYMMKNVLNVKTSELQERFNISERQVFRILKDKEVENIAKNMYTHKWCAYLSSLNYICSKAKGEEPKDYDRDLNERLEISAMIDTIVSSTLGTVIELRKPNKGDFDLNQISKLTDGVQ